MIEFDFVSAFFLHQLALKNDPYVPLHAVKDRAVIRWSDLGIKSSLANGMEETPKKEESVLNNPAPTDESAQRSHDDVSLPIDDTPTVVVDTSKVQHAENDKYVEEVVLEKLSFDTEVHISEGDVVPAEDNEDKEESPADPTREKRRSQAPTIEEMIARIPQDSDEEWTMTDARSSADSGDADSEPEYEPPNTGKLRALARVVMINLRWAKVIF